MRRGAEAREPALDDLQRERFLRATASFALSVLEAEVGAPD
jgi:hypothetical protein